MKLSNKSLSKLVHGAVQSKNIKNGYVVFYRFSDEQIEYFKFNDFFYDRTKFSASIIIKFKTNAKNLSFKYKINSKKSSAVLSKIFLVFSYSTLTPPTSRPNP